MFSSRRLICLHRTHCNHLFGIIDVRFDANFAVFLLQSRIWIRTSCHFPYGSVEVIIILAINYLLIDLKLKQNLISLDLAVLAVPAYFLYCRALIIAALWIWELFPSMCHLKKCWRKIQLPCQLMRLCTIVLYIYINNFSYNINYWLILLTLWNLYF